MSEHVIHLLDLFETLSEPDKRSAFVEILHRSPPGEADIAPAGMMRLPLSYLRPLTQRMVFPRQA